jgi:hypothetical protein
MRKKNRWIAHDILRKLQSGAIQKADKENLSRKPGF